MDLSDHVRTGQAEQLVVALDFIGQGREARAHFGRELWPTVAAILRFVQAKALNHGAHGTVEDQDPLTQQIGQLGGTGVAWHDEARR